MEDLRIIIKGEVTASNFVEWNAALIQRINETKTELITDEDFADADVTIKSYKSIEKRLDEVKQTAMEQSSDIMALFDSIDKLRSHVRDKRLVLNRQLTHRKKEIRIELINSSIKRTREELLSYDGVFPLLDHSDLLAKNDFANAIKGKSSLVNAQSALDRLIESKINEIARRFDLVTHNEHLLDYWHEYEFLFHDRKSLLLKATEDLERIISNRIDSYNESERLKKDYYPAEDAELHDTINELVKLSVDQGFLTYRDIHIALPSSVKEPDQIEYVISYLLESEIEIIDPDEVEDFKENQLDGGLLDHEDETERVRFGVSTDDSQNPSTTVDKDGFIAALRCIANGENPFTGNQFQKSLLLNDNDFVRKLHQLIAEIGQCDSGNASTIDPQKFDEEYAYVLLRRGSGIPEASFRHGQLEAIEQLTTGNHRLLVVQKTGWGKSFVYFIATKMLRKNGGGPAVLISPLLSLMRNQKAAAERMGLSAVTINSDNQNKWSKIETQIQNDEVDILLISPERLANQQFLQDILSVIGLKVSMLIIDEAHCISDWGHDFRPHYRLIKRLSKNLPEGHRLLATTATANNRVKNDISDVLGPNLKVICGSLARPSLYLQTMRFKNIAERLAWLADHIPTIAGSGIIYCLTKKDALRIEHWLKTRGINAVAYTGSSNNRPKLEQQLIDDKLKVLVATTALGMGFDKPNLAFVIHFQTPGSVVAYYQQVGRAGRAIKGAYGILLSGPDEDNINDYFIDSAFPKINEVKKIITALSKEPTGLSVLNLCSMLNIPNGRIYQALNIMSLESPAPVVKEGSKWILTPNDLNDSFWERVQRITAIRQEEFQEMKEYVALDSGHMEFLMQALDSEPEEYQPPDLTPINSSFSKETLKDVHVFLKRSNFPIKPRQKWIFSGGLPTYGFHGNIPEAYQVEEGRALSFWGDLGFAELVKEGKKSGCFANELVEAMTSMLFDWSPEPRPAWLTYVPSLRNPTLVPDFAERLAMSLNIPLVETIIITKNYPPQKTMQNCQQQLNNLDGVFDVIPDNILPGACYLLDDMVDSKWTFTVTGYLLKKAQAAEIYPIALASTRLHED